MTNKDKNNGNSNGDGFSSESKEVLEKTITKIKKQHGDGAVFTLGGDEWGRSINVEYFSTRIPTLDMAMQLGGIPWGRIGEIYGPESSGKTTLCLHILAAAQEQHPEGHEKRRCLFIDMEHALDPAYAARLGVNLGELLVSQPDHGEQALDIAQAMVESGTVGLVVIDSVSALVPKAELDGDMATQSMALQARMMSKHLRRITPSANNHKCTVIFVNQIREKIGVVFGNPETTSGGRALKFSASFRIDVRRGTSIKSGAEIIGHDTKVKIVKNKVAAPFGSGVIPMISPFGAKRSWNIFQFAVDHEIIAKSGSFYSFDGDRLAQGRENSIAALEEKPGLLEKIEAAIYERVLPSTLISYGVDEEDLGDDVSLEDFESEIQLATELEVED